MMKEWKQFMKVRGILKKVNHPLIINLFQDTWKEFIDLNIKPSQLNNSTVAQDFLKVKLVEIKKQAEACLYIPFSYIKKKNDLIYESSSHMLEIIEILKEY